MSAPRCLPALLLAAAPCLAAQDGGAWFPAPCPEDPEAPALPAGAELAWVRAAPSDPGRDVTLRRAADGALWASPEDVRRWLGRDPSRSASRPEHGDWIPLSELPELVTRFDRCRQELLVDWAPSARPVNVIAARARSPRTPEREAGGYLNLDVSYSGSSAGTSGLGGLAALGAFNGWGAGTTTWFDDGAGRSVRLDSTWFYDWPDRPARISAGDTFTNAAGWGAPVRFGGLRWGTEFSLQPDRITFPLPGVEGVAQVPSMLDVYVNGVRQHQAPAPTGPFVLTDVPVLTGAGELQVEILDALGRRQRIVQPYYVAPQLLKPGLDEYSFEAGWLRENYSLESADYGEPFGAWGWKHGATETFTWQQRMEAGDDLFSAGTSLFWLWPSAGLWSTETVLTRAQGQGGVMLGAGFERSAQRYSVAFRHREAFGLFARLGEAPGELRHSSVARFAVRPWHAGTISIVRLEEVRSSIEPLRLWGLTWSQGLGTLGSGYVGATVPEQGEPQLVAGFVRSFGPRRAASVQGQQQGEFSILQTQFQQGPPGPLGADWRLTVDSGDSDRSALYGNYSTTRGTLSGDVARWNGSETWHMGATTGVALLDGSAFWTRPVRDAFTVVNTDGVAGVRVYQDNLPVGRTREDGRLLVPGLRPYEDNALRVDERDWPLDRFPVHTRLAVVPAAGGGVTARFPTAPEAVTLRLVREDGTPVPAGAELRAGGRALDLPVGRDGRAYVEMIAEREVLEARWRDGACAVEVQRSGAPAPVVCLAPETAP